MFGWGPAGSAPAPPLPCQEVTRPGSCFPATHGLAREYWTWALFRKRPLWETSPVPCWVVGPPLSPAKLCPTSLCPRSPLSPTALCGTYCRQQRPVLWVGPGLGVRGLRAAGQWGLCEPQCVEWDSLYWW